ncbi:MAG: glycosyltransferase family 2 protein [Magnetococcales bacterium]|nr:glycosyltransferase family 2 protein [Magnetococcales bacterium]MBF0149586.1 glycosyltransferase family 2 protein [Magnetococcales bacterium]
MTICHSNQTRHSPDSVAIVIPMYNEEASIELLAYRLKGTLRILSEHTTPHLVLVDDGSLDHTYEYVERSFSGVENLHLLRHERNKGYSAALKTGIGHALQLNTDLIVTIDADTNYDHFYIPMFVECFPEDCDILTASPWHPQGQRKYFPWHRLVLSLTLSALYRFVLARYGTPLYTYSSCFRVARPEVYRRIKWTGESFTATSEILARCIINRLRVVEFPFQVNPRWFGISKMKKIKQIKMHIQLLWQLWRNPEKFIAE